METAHLIGVPEVLGFKDTSRYRIVSLASSCNYARRYFQFRCHSRSFSPRHLAVTARDFVWYGMPVGGRAFLALVALVGFGDAAEVRLRCDEESSRESTDPL